MSSNILPVSARPDTVMLPADLSTPLTAEQTAALWGGDLHAGLRRMVAAVQQKHVTEQQKQPTPAAASVQIGATRG